MFITFISLAKIRTKLSAFIFTGTDLILRRELNKYTKDATCLIVSQRIGTIMNADKIIVLSHGEIIEEGSHNELLNKKGKYYNLYTLQYNKELLKKGV